MTFYVTDITRPWNSVATLPNFTIEEAADLVSRDRSYNDNCIPMTAAERKKFLKACDPFELGSEFKEVYESMKDTFLYNRFLESSDDSTISYSFWVTSAFDSRSTIFAFGADTVGDYKFNLNRISKKLGERRFYNYAVGKGKRVKDFSALLRILNDSGVSRVNVTKDELIEAANEGRYYTCWRD